VAPGLGRILAIAALVVLSCWRRDTAIPQLDLLSARRLNAEANFVKITHDKFSKLILAKIIKFTRQTNFSAINYLPCDLNLAHRRRYCRRCLTETECLDPRLILSALQAPCVNWLREMPTPRLPPR
jgi:hypothetical protein